LGRFQITFDDLSGEGTAILRVGMGQKEERSFWIDKWFAPDAREFTETEKETIARGRSAANSLAPEKISSMDKSLPEVAVKGKRRHLDWQPLNHSLVRFGVLEESEWLIDNEPKTAADMKERSVVAGLDFCMISLKHHHFPQNRTTRFVAMPGKYLGDAEVPSYAVISDLLISNPMKYKQMIVRTDRAACEAYNYGVRPTTGNRKDMFLGYVGLNRRGNERNPSILLFLEPYGNEESRNLHYYNQYPDTRFSHVHGYSVFPKFDEKQPYRRTLYWNPSVTTDANGDAIVEFQNTATCCEMVISAEGITEDGSPILLTP